MFEDDSVLQGLSLLVIEDDLDSRELLVFILQAQGAKVTATDSIHAALEQLEQFSFDIILCDGRLPDGDGYSFLKKWRNHEAQLGRNPIPAIAVTGGYRDGDAINSAGVDFQAWISKPIELSTVIQTIAKLTHHP